MSTCYRFSQNVSKVAFNKAMKNAGVKDAKSEHASDDDFCITDGDSYLWVYPNSDGQIREFCRYGGNYDAENFLREIAEELQVELMSEYDDNFFDEGELEELREVADE
jgi:hypothetical protein